MTTTAIQAAATYFSAWKDKDFERLRAVLADDSTFAGPLGTAGSGDECRDALQRLSEIVTDVVVQRRFADGDDVLTWFDLHTSVAPPAAVANWSHVVDGRIDRVRVTFDPRPLVTR